MNNLAQRAIAGAVYVLLVVAAAAFSFTSLCVILSVLLFQCSSELGKLLGMTERQTSQFQLLSVLSFYFILAPIFIDLGDYIYIPFAIVSAVIMGLIGSKQYDMVFGLVYLAFPLALLAFLGVPDLRFINGSWEPVEGWTAKPILAFFLLMWTYDTFAYLVGKWLGKHQLAPSISPKKTWEGLFGGLSFTILAAIILSNEWHFPRSFIIPISIIVVVFGTIGDLLESYIKRKADVKDSGGIMPGHGGLLDRLDGVFIAAPAVVCYVYLYKNLLV